MLERALISCIVAAALLTACTARAERARDNGDIYVVNVTKLQQDGQQRNAQPVNATIVVGVMYGEAYDDNSGYADSDVEEQEQEHDNGNQAADDGSINLDDIMAQCNASFSMPVESLIEFNNTGALPDEVDKTGMCFLRCFYEKAGIIANWQLNAQMIRDYMWPATGDSIDVCQKQGDTETNACVRTYAIFKCLMIRAITDARNKPVV